MKHSERREVKNRLTKLFYKATEIFKKYRYMVRGIAFRGLFLELCFAHQPISTKKKEGVNMNRVPAIMEALCYFLLKIKKADKIHLVKLMYLADKYHLMNYGRTISGDDFIALEHGPAGSQTMDVLEYDEYVLGSLKERAMELFTPGEGHYEYLPGNNCAAENFTMLSESDIYALDFVLEKFGSMKKWDLVDYTHKLPEWKKYETKFKKGETRKESIPTTEVLLVSDEKDFSVSREHIKESCDILTGAFD